MHQVWEFTSQREIRVPIASRLAPLGLALAASIAACGGGKPEAGFTTDQPSTGNGPNGPGGGGSSGGDSPSLGCSDDAGGGGGGDAAACETTTAQAQLVPVYLVFMFDRSGSMKYNPPSNHWDACVAGLDNFFTDQKSAGLFASMQVFPYDNNECSTSTYQAPIVAATALPDTGNAFMTALSQNGPQPNYGTPTLPAFKGAMAYAQQLQSQFKNGEKVAVVLVTDGDPNDCNSSPNNVGQEAAKSAATIPTYVVGVGSSLSNLNTIAKGGGTNAAILVDTSNPNQITTDFTKAVGEIRASALTCDYQIPAPPAGETLDPNKVNVVYTPDGGNGQTLSYNKDCSGTGQGWHYDDPTNPAKIQMCGASCDTLKSAAGRVDIVLGCATQGGVTR